MQGDSHKAFHKSKKIAFVELLILTRRYYFTFFFQYQN